MKQRSAQIGQSTKTRNQNLSLLLFALPALAVYALFKLYPAFSGIFYAMTDWNGVDKGWSFIGLENFARVLQDEYFWQSILFTLKYVIVMVVVANVIALTLAVAIETRPAARGLFRTIFYMPNMISMVIGGYMWMFIFTKVLYYFVDNFDGFSFLDHMWIGDPRYSFLAIIIVAAWGAVGYLMIIYMAAIQGVPESIKEAAVARRSCAAIAGSVLRRIARPFPTCSIPADCRNGAHSGARIVVPESTGDPFRRGR